MIVNVIFAITGADYIRLMMLKLILNNAIIISFKKLGTVGIFSVIYYSESPHCAIYFNEVKWQNYIT